MQVETLNSPRPGKKKSFTMTEAVERTDKFQEILTTVNSVRHVKIILQD